jgi:hypothetical protein
VSQRLDVPTDHLDAWRVPTPGAPVIGTEDEAVMKAREDMIPLLNEVFGNR